MYKPITGKKYYTPRETYRGFHIPVSCPKIRTAERPALVPRDRQANESVYPVLANISYAQTLKEVSTCTKMHALYVHKTIPVQSVVVGDHLETSGDRIQINYGIIRVAVTVVIDAHLPGNA